MHFKSQRKIGALIDTALEWIIYLSVFLVPLVFIPQVNSVFTTPKLYVFRVVTLVVILLWAFRGIVKPKWKVRWSPFLWFVIAFAGISMLNTFFSVSHWTSIIGTYGRFVGIFTLLNFLFWIYIIITEVNSARKIRNVLWVSVSTAFLVSIYGILQHFDLFVNIFSWSQDPLERAFSSIGHSNHTAAYLGMNIMLLIGLIRTSKFGWRKITLWIGIIFVSVALILTASRGAVFAVLVALICWLVYGLRKKHFVKEIKKYSKIILTVIVLTFLIGVVFRGPLSQLPIIQRSVETVEFVKGGNIPDRVSWWLSSLEMIQERPLLGHGLSTYRDVYNKFRRVDYKVEGDAQDHITPQSSHMEYLTIGATQGIIGLAVYLLMIVFVFIYGARFMKSAKEANDRVVMYALLTGIVVYLVQVLISFGVITTLFMLYTLIGLVISYTVLDKRPKNISLNIALRSIIGIILVVLIAVGMVYSYLFLQAEYEYKQANVQVAQRDIKQAINHYTSAISTMPYVSEYFEGYGDFLFELGISMPEGAQEPYLVDALEVYNDSLWLNWHLPHVSMNKGLVLSRLAVLRDDDRYEEMAILSMKSVADNNRNNPVYFYRLAEMYEFFERHGEAYEQYKKVLEIRDPYLDSAEKIKMLEEKYVGSPSS